MKTKLLTLIAAAAITASTGAQAAQAPAERLDTIQERIEAGQRTGLLSRWEADGLRQEHRVLVRMQSQSRSHDRRDFERRLERLAADTRPIAVDSRQAVLTQRLDRSLRNGRLTRAEARNLQNEYQEIVRLEDQYRRNGLTATETMALERRLDRLTAQLRDDRQQYGYGYGHEGSRR